MWRPEADLGGGRGSWAANGHAVRGGDEFVGVAGGGTQSVLCCSAGCPRQQLQRLAATHCMFCSASKDRGTARLCRTLGTLPLPRGAQLAPSELLHNLLSWVNPRAVQDHLVSCTTWEPALPRRGTAASWPIKRRSALALLLTGIVEPRLNGSHAGATSAGGPVHGRDGSASAR